AHYVLGRGAAIRGSVDDALQHFQTAEALSERAGDPEWRFWALVGMVRIVSQRLGRDSAAPILSAARAAATRRADPQVTAALHAFVGEIEGKAGLFTSAERHSVLALELLSGAPNAWLESVARNTRLIVALFRGDLSLASEIAESTLELVFESGVA